MPSGDVVESGGWRPPPRWVWAVAGVVAAAVLAGVVVARGGPHHAAASSRSKSPTAATSPVPGSRTPVAGPAARWPSAAGACGSPVYLPQIHLARHHARVHGRVLVGGTALRQVTLGRAVTRPLPGLPDHGRLVTKLVAGPGAYYAFDLPCSSSSPSLRVYRIVAGAAHHLNTTADDLLGGPHRAWAVTYLAHHTVLTALTGGRAVTLKSHTTPLADTAAGLMVVAHHDLLDLPDTLELVDPNTGALLRRFAEATAGRVPISDAVFSPGGTEAAFQLARASQDPRFTTGWPYPPSDVVVLHLHTGSLDIVPGLELPPLTWAGLAFDATGRWLLTTVSEGERGELLAWRQGMPGPALVTTLPGPLVTAPPLLPRLSS